MAVNDDTTQSVTSDTSRVSSSLGAWGDDPEIQEKVQYVLMFDM